MSYGGDCGPYRQSERRDIYRKYVQQLLDAGKAYIAFDTPEELEEKRKTVANFQYDATTRTSMRNSLVLPREEVDALIAGGAQYVVRFLVTPDVEVEVDDMIRGRVTSIAPSSMTRSSIRVLTTCLLTIWRTSSTTI